MKLLELPDTALVNEARALLDAAAPAPIRSHSLRTFLFGRTYGHKRGLAFDEEGLALAALFHDLGLCPEHRDWRVPFPRVGARALEAHLRARGVAAERVAPLCDAIDFHNQLFPRWSKGDVAGLLQVGAWMDVVGRKRGSLGEEAAQIRAAHPPEPTGWTFWKGVLPALGPATCVGTFFPRLLG